MKTKLIVLTILGLFLFSCQSDSDEFYLENDSQSKVLKKYGSDGEIYNVSDGCDSNMTEYFFQVANHLGLPKPPTGFTFTK
mgnify:CR=1 FL=1